MGLVSQGGWQCLWRSTRNRLGLRVGLMKERKGKRKSQPRLGFELQTYCIPGRHSYHLSYRESSDRGALFQFLHLPITQQNMAGKDRSWQVTTSTVRLRAVTCFLIEPRCLVRGVGISGRTAMSQDKHQKRDRVKGGAGASLSIGKVPLTFTLHLFAQAPVLCTRC